MVGDPSMRLGSHIANGHCDIFDHSWFNEFNWEALLNRSMIACHIPKLRSQDDTSNYNDYPESESDSEDINIANDPFLDW